jgi:asparagine synthase (glutamine-hydrolysing)
MQGTLETTIFARKGSIAVCGIAGFLSCGQKDQGPRLGQAVLQVLSHRGPDDHGWLMSSPREYRLGQGNLPAFDAEIILLHRRLSILDLSKAGWQPMSTPDGRFFIVFNGEIYNFVELRAELELLGHVFQSHGDTEALLHAYVEWGPRALNRLVGMFSFAILDRLQRMLFLARDFFGIKPLYYTHTPFGFGFASEIKALLAVPGVSRRVNPQRLHAYLTTGMTDHGRETMFADIFQVPAAHCLEISLDSPTMAAPRRYWNVDLNDRLDISFREATARLRQLFLDSVRLHLRSDVPVGAALSGGIDSSAIVNAMRYLEPRLELHTFSYIADTPQLSEEAWVDLAASKAGAVVHKIQAAPEELLSDLERLIFQQDEPFGSTSIYLQHRVFRLARETGITVMLDGQGADEMLGGYRPYLAARLATLVRQGQWLKAFRFLNNIRHIPGTGGMLRLLLQCAAFLVPEKCKFLGKQWLERSVMPPWLNERWFDEHGVHWRRDAAEPSLERRAVAIPHYARHDYLRRHLHRTLMETSLPMLLRYEDRNSMAQSIESRVPFLTPDLACFLLKLPEEYLIGLDGTSKRIFRAAMRGIVPDPVLDRRDKIGFATPEQQWFTRMRPWVEKTLDGADNIPAFHAPALRNAWQAVIEKKHGFDFRPWRWVNLIRWAEQFDVQFM